MGNVSPKEKPGKTLWNWGNFYLKSVDTSGYY